VATSLRSSVEARAVFWPDSTAVTSMSRITSRRRESCRGCSWLSGEMSPPAAWPHRLRCAAEAEKKGGASFGGAPEGDRNGRR
jgi:vacuolar-type H+-ATPase catalytic subunit A/Vma1